MNYAKFTILLFASLLVAPHATVYAAYSYSEDNEEYELQTLTPRTLDDAESPAILLADRLKSLTEALEAHDSRDVNQFISLVDYLKELTETASLVAKQRAMDAKEEERKEFHADRQAKRERAKMTQQLKLDLRTATVKKEQAAKEQRIIQNQQKKEKQKAHVATILAAKRELDAKLLEARGRSPKASGVLREHQKYNQPPYSKYLKRQQQCSLA